MLLVLFLLDHGIGELQSLPGFVSSGSFKLVSGGQRRAARSSDWRLLVKILWSRLLLLRFWLLFEAAWVIFVCSGTSTGSPWRLLRSKFTHILCTTIQSMLSPGFTQCA